jgi:hypothetical protein
VQRFAVEQTRLTWAGTHNFEGLGEVRFGAHPELNQDVAALWESGCNLTKEVTSGGSLGRLATNRRRPLILGFMATKP